MHDGTPDDGDLGELADSRDLRWGGDSETYSNRKLGEPADALDESFGVSGHLLARAGDSGARDRVNKAGRNLGDQLQSLVGRSGRSQKDGREVVLARLAQILGRFFYRQIGDQRSVNPRKPRNLAEFFDAHAQNGIEIGEDHRPTDWECSRISAASVSTLQRRSMLERALAGALNHGTVGERVAEGDAELDDARTGLDRREDDVARGREVGIAASYVSHEGRLF